jgi:hypothetical protein
MLPPRTLTDVRKKLTRKKNKETETKKIGVAPEKFPAFKLRRKIQKLENHVSNTAPNATEYPEAFEGGTSNARGRTEQNEQMYALPLIPCTVIDTRPRIRYKETDFNFNVGGMPRIN